MLLVLEFYFINYPYRTSVTDESRLYIQFQRKKNVTTCDSLSDILSRTCLNGHLYL